MYISNRQEKVTDVDQIGKLGVLLEKGLIQKTSSYCFNFFQK